MRSLGVPFAAALAATALLAGSAAAQNSAHSPRAVFSAVRVTRAPVIDGQLDDEAWQGVEPVTNFTQQDPQEGQPATERTELRITYDDEAVYVAARMYDKEAGRIARRLSSRDDESDADSFDFYLDAMHDHQTGAGFQISAAGVQRDAVLYNDTWDDSSWDSVWQFGGHRRRAGLDRRVAHPAVAAALHVRRASDVGRQRDAVHPPQERARLARARAEERKRPRLADGPPDRDGRAPSEAARGVAAVHGRPCRVRAACPGRQPLQRWVACLRGGRSRPEMGRDQQPDARRYGQPGLRPGRGRPGGRQPVAVRDLLSREAAVLPRGRADLRQFRRDRRQQLLGVQHVRSRDLLLAADRPDAAGVSLG